MFITIIGLTAVFFQSIRIIPQVIKGYRSKSVRDVSLSWEIIGAISSVLWLVYGIYFADIWIISGNIINLACYLLLMHQKYIYR